VLYSHLVTYAPSATVLYLLRTARSTEQATLPFLGVGDVDHGQQATSAQNSNESGNSGGSVSRGLYDLAGARFPRLPGTRQEVVSSAEIFGKKSVVLLGREATEAAFKSQPLAEFRVIHLAVHGIANTKFPERAALVLGIDPASQEDGLLQAREISVLSLNADLVTLSACDTGVGRLQGEEGIANLVRAFLLAGARTVVATLWSADDTFTTALIKEFYGRLSEGQDKGSALRQAKIDLLKKFGEETLPYYWAGFIMVGEGHADRRAVDRQVSEIRKAAGERCLIHRLQKRQFRPWGFSVEAKTAPATRLGEQHIEK
jgi:CHAT domain-containing protein